MHWNGAFAAMLFLNRFEYTGGGNIDNQTFAREQLWPLVSGLVSWSSCYLARSTGADGRLLLEDWNAVDPDGESAHTHRIRLHPRSDRFDIFACHPVLSLRLVAENALRLNRLIDL